MRNRTRGALAAILEGMISKSQSVTLITSQDGREQSTVGATTGSGLGLIATGVGLGVGVGVGLSVGSLVGAGVGVQAVTKEVQGANARLIASTVAMTSTAITRAYGANAHLPGSLW